MALLALSVAALVVGAAAQCDIAVYSLDPPGLFQEEFQDMPANFGPQLSTEGMRAFVTVGEPRNGCGPLQPPPSSIDNFTGNWVVLLARYNCSFEAKVRNAQAANYDGVIVHNVDSNELEIMSADNKRGIKIPSVFIGERAAEIIEHNYTYDKGKGYFIVMNGNYPFNNLNLLLPFGIVVVLCFIIMIVFLVIRCIREQRRARRHRLPNSSLKKIPICKFAKGDPYDTCAICLDDYVEGDKLRVLPCAHAYHCKCIDPWLTKNRRVCPVCKRTVFAQGERRATRRRAERTREPRGSSSESDTGDDRTPLVNSSSSGQNTQGGTFNSQRENPFVRASRERERRQNRARNAVQAEARTTPGSSWPAFPGGSRGSRFLTGVLNLRGNTFAQPQPQEEDTRSLNDDRQSLIAAGPSSTASRSPSSKAPSVREMSVDGGGGKKRSRKSNRASRKKEQQRQGSANSGDDQSRVEADDGRSNREEEFGDAEGRERSAVVDVGRIGVAALPNFRNVRGDSPSRRGGSDFIV